MYEKPSRRLEVHKPFTYGDDAYAIKEREGREVYDMIIEADDIGPILAKVDQKETHVVRLLSPENRRMKYCTRVVTAKVSSDPTKYRDRLHIRFQRGLLHPKPWSIEITKIQEGMLVVPQGTART
ncbi:MAG: hypothetical protein Q7J31_17585 [Syntrophales bacterium]|nr:hypothetical protein [Syntrophales bacterium]